MTAAVADRVARALREGPQPCEAHRLVDEPMAAAGLREADRCGNPLTALYLIGCIHEHVIELWMCQGCAHPDEARQYCGACFDGDDRHVCDVVVSPAGGAR